MSYIPANWVEKSDTLQIVVAASINATHALPSQKLLLISATLDFSVN